MADHDDRLKTGEEDALLEDFFAAARSDAQGEPSPGLLARILEDGYAEQDRIAAAPVQRRGAEPHARRGLLATLLATIGGAPGLAGLACAALAGLWIGISPPAGLGDATLALWRGSAAAGEADEDLLDYDMAYADLLADS